GQCRAGGRGGWAIRRYVVRLPVAGLRIVAVSERNHLAALQQPSEAGAVVSRQAAVTGVPPFWRLVEAEQVRRRPAQRFGLLAPLGQKPASVSDALPPAAHPGQGRRPGRRPPSGTAAPAAARRSRPWRRRLRPCRRGRRIEVLKVLRVGRGDVLNFSLSRRPLQQDDDFLKSAYTGHLQNPQNLVLKVLSVPLLPAFGIFGREVSRGADRPWFTSSRPG